MAACDSDLTKFHLEFNKLKSLLTGYGRGDLNFMEDFEFREYMKCNYDDDIYPNSALTIDDLIRSASNMYTLCTHKDNHIWGSKVTRGVRDSCHYEFLHRNWGKQCKTLMIKGGLSHLAMANFCFSPALGCIFLFEVFALSQSLHFLAEWLASMMISRKGQKWMPWWSWSDAALIFGFRGFGNNHIIDGVLIFLLVGDSNYSKVMTPINSLPHHSIYEATRITWQSCCTWEWAFLSKLLLSGLIFWVVINFKVHFFKNCVSILWQFFS